MNKNSPSNNTDELVPPIRGTGKDLIPANKKQGDDEVRYVTRHGDDKIPPAKKSRYETCHQTTTTRTKTYRARKKSIAQKHQSNHTPRSTNSKKPTALRCSQRTTTKSALVLV